MTPGFEVPNVQPGEPILPAWQKLKTAVHGSQVHGSRLLRRRQMPSGTALTVDARGQTWPHPFKCSLAGQAVAVRAGRVAGIVPRINGIDLEGYDEAGELAGTPPTVPLLGGPDDRLRSYICIELAVDETTGQVAEDDPDALTVTHRASFESDDPLRGLMPLAEIVWRDEKTPERIFQIVLHNLQHLFVPAAPGRAAKHFFYPA